MWILATVQVVPGASALFLEDQENMASAQNCDSDLLWALIPGGLLDRTMRFAHNPFPLILPDTTPLELGSTRGS